MKMPKERSKSKISDSEKAKKYERARMLANERVRRHKARKSEEQLQKKREQDRISAQKRRIHVKDMTEKEKKAARKVWRQRKRQQQKIKKESEEILATTPPVSADEVTDTLRNTSRQNEIGKKIAKKNRLKIIKELKDYKEENEKLQQKLEKYKKRLQREKPNYKKHVFQMYHQAKQLKHLKETPKDKEILFQVDFSQNYVAKHSTEVQSLHFGASQKQISLHTGVKYVKLNDKVSCTTFCTVSDQLDHQAHGVWSHLKPILTETDRNFPNTKTVHFYTDSSSSQYRNKVNVFLMKNLMPKYFKNLEQFTWNYTESGHGKGVMDGVGGSLKRNSDLNILHQKEVTCARDFVDQFTKSKTTVIEVKPEEFAKIKSLIPENLEPVVGIMNVKQITWSKNTKTLQFRKLSCFECELDEECVHHNLFSIGPDGKQKTTKSTTNGEKMKKLNKQETKKKTILKISDVYTSDEDEEDVQPDSDNAVQIKEAYTFEELT